METALNAISCVIGVILIIVWIVSLAKWDGKCPCKPSDCEDCPYSGTGCEIDPNTKIDEGV